MAGAPPAAPPPANKPSRQAELIGVTVFLTVFATFFVGARLYTRVFTTRSFGWDDAFLALAVAASWVSESSTIKQAKLGLGLTGLEVDPNNIAELLKYTQIGIFMNGLVMCFLKVGIGLSLLRLRLSKIFNYAVLGCLAISLLVNLIVFPGFFAQCRPMNRLWNKAIPGTCWGPNASLAFSYTQTVGNIVTDFAFTFGPLYYLANVKVSHYNKWALRGVFTIGLIATACAIAKATELPRNQHSKDPTYDTVDLTILVVAEAAAGLFAAALPPLKTTFESLLTKVFGVHSGLTTPSATRRKGGGSHSYTNSRTLRSANRRPAPGSTMGTGFELEDDEMPHGTATVYAMNDMRAKKKWRSDRESEAMSEEDDQRHILHAASVKTGSDGNAEGDGGPQGDWITKTIEYTISDSQSIHQPETGSRRR